MTEQLFKTCGQCQHGVVHGQNLAVRMCFGAPPSPLVLPQMGPDGQARMQLTNFRPTVNVSDRACGFFKQKVLIENDPPKEIDASE